MPRGFGERGLSAALRPAVNARCEIGPHPERLQGISTAGQPPVFLCVADFDFAMVVMWWTAPAPGIEVP